MIFERYNDNARRAIFFARKAAGQFGASNIDSQHLLLGILKAEILAFTAEEADALAHSKIGPEHLIAGTLREEQSRAARMLQERGVQLDEVRRQLREQGDAHDAM